VRVVDRSRQRGAHGEGRYTESCANVRGALDDKQIALPARDAESRSELHMGAPRRRQGGSSPSTFAHRLMIEQSLQT